MKTPVTIAILAVTAIVTFIAFHRRDVWERLMFKPLEILRYKQYERMLTCGVIHGDGWHFAFNAYSFLSFGRLIEALYGPYTLLLVYVSSILGGSLLSLIIHRHHDYRSLGASGGVCGVIFASIFLVPGSSVGLFLLPVAMPPFIFAILFLIVSFVGHRSKSDNIGHDAHLGGAIVGLVVAAGRYPELVFSQPWMFATVLGLSLLILTALIKDPLGLWTRRFSGEAGHRPHERFQRYDEARERNAKMSEIDRLLDKVAAEGLGSLSREEREKLERISKELKR
jgi:membrane associated rhomboid family serine protease